MDNATFLHMWFVNAVVWLPLAAGLYKILAAILARVSKVAGIEQSHEKDLLVKD